MSFQTACNMLKKLKEHNPSLLRDYTQFVEKTKGFLFHRPGFSAQFEKCEDATRTPLYATTIPGDYFFIMSEMISSLRVSERPIVRIDPQIRSNFMPLLVYFPNLNILTTIRLWGQMDTIIDSLKTPDFGWVLHQNDVLQTKWFSPNYFQLNRANFERMRRPLYSDMIRMFDFLYWTCRPRGYRNGPQLRVRMDSVQAGTSSTSRLKFISLIRHWKSLFIIESEGKTFHEGGRERNRFPTVKMKGLKISKNQMTLVPCDYRYKDHNIDETRSVVINSKHLQWILESQRSEYPIVINGMITQVERKVPKMAFLTYGKRISSFEEFLPYALGIAIDCEYKSSEKISHVGSLSKLRHTIEMFIGYFDIHNEFPKLTTAEGWNSLTESIESLFPFVILEEESQDIWLLHPGLFSIFSEQSILPKLKNKEWMLNFLNQLESFDSSFELGSCNSPILEELGPKKFLSLFRDARNLIEFSKKVCEYY